MKLGTAYVEIRADGKRLSSELKKTERTVRKSASKMQSAMKLVFPITGAVAFGLAIREMTQFMKSAVGIAGKMEQWTIAFKTMTGSANVTKKLLKDIANFAAKTPFQLTGLIQSSEQLLAFGIETENIIDTMRNLGNIAAGVGSDKLPTLVRAFGKIRTRGKATMEELNMLLEAGVPILDSLAKGYNVTTQELFKMITQGKVGFEDVDKALRDLSTGSGMFANLMIEQSKSYLGMLSNLEDTIDELKIRIGTKLLPYLQNMLDIINKLFPKKREEISFSEVIEGLKKMGAHEKRIMLIRKQEVQSLKNKLKLMVNIYDRDVELNDLLKMRERYSNDIIIDEVEILGIKQNAIINARQLTEEEHERIEWLESNIELWEDNLSQIAQAEQLYKEIQKLLNEIKGITEDKAKITRKWLDGMVLSVDKLNEMMMDKSAKFELKLDTGETEDILNEFTNFYNKYLKEDEDSFLASLQYKRSQLKKYLDENVISYQTYFDYIRETQKTFDEWRENQMIHYSEWTEMIYSATGDTFASEMSRMLKITSDTTNDMERFFISFVNTVVEGIARIVAKLIAAKVIKGILSLIGIPIPGLGKGGKIDGQIVEPIIYAQHGGIFKKPTLAAIAEKPGMQEAVIPLQNGRVPVQLGGDYAISMEHMANEISELKFAMMSKDWSPNINNNMNMRFSQRDMGFIVQEGNKFNRKTRLS